MPELAERRCKFSGCRKPFTPHRRDQIFCPKSDCRKNYWAAIRERAKELGARETGS